jgi:hypothetical protein
MAFVALAGALFVRQVSTPATAAQPPVAPSASGNAAPAPPAADVSG